jgi:hypothetical protein
MAFDPSLGYDPDVFSADAGSSGPGYDPKIFTSPRDTKKYREIPSREEASKILGFNVGPMPETIGPQQTREAIGAGLSDWLTRIQQLGGYAKTGQMDYGPANEKAALDKPLRESLHGTIASGVGQGLPLAALGPAGAGYKGAALTGALAGLGTPALSPNDNWINPVLGASVGTLAKGAIDIGGYLGNGLYNYVGQNIPSVAEKIRGRIFNTVAGDKAPDVIAALEKPKINVPGSAPISGELAADTGAAPFVAFQEQLKGRPGASTAYEARDAANEAARRLLLSNNNPLPGTIKQAEGARAAQALTDYGAAYQQKVLGNPNISNLTSNPYFQDAVPDALKLAKANNVDPSTDLFHFLHYVKIGLDKQLNRTGDTALANTEKSAVQSLKADLVQWMGDNNPAYETARQNFANASKPINQAQVTDLLMNKLTSATGAERPAILANAIREAPATIKKATGQGIADELSQIYTPQQMSNVQGLLSDVQRQAQYKSLATGPGAQEARSLLGGLSETKTLPNALYRPIMIINAALRRIEYGASEKTLNQMAQDMLDPKKVASLMKATPLNQRPELDLAIQSIRNTVLGGLSGTANPAAGLLGIRQPAEQ